ncbi:MAG: ATP-binding protein [Thermodesulfobacteriota bacterium]
MKKISSQQIIQRLRTENPWWETGAISAGFRKLRPRAYLSRFLPLATSREIRRATVLMGPRRVGKTVMIHHTIQALLDQKEAPRRIAYFSMDHPIFNGLGIEEMLERYAEAAGVNLQADECHLFFDEIQYLKDWEIQLKVLVDRLPNLKFTVSGSVAAALRLKSVESGAGRFTDFLLPPLNFHEYLDLLEETDLVIPPETPEGFFQTESIQELNQRFIHYLNFGGYPEVVFSEAIQSDPGRFIKGDIIDKVLLRDLPSLYGIQDIQELNSLFATLAFNSAEEVSLEALSKDSGVSKNTLKKYMEYLEAAFLIRRVHRIDENARRFKRANFFKVYLTNPSIRTALFAPISEEDPAMGNLAETAIFAQWFHSEALLYYARWKGGEVDIIRLDPRQKVDWAMEVKWTDRFFRKPKELKNRIKFCHTNHIRNPLITTWTQTGTREVENLELRFVPAALHCYTLGHKLVTGGNHRNV